MPRAHISVSLLAVFSPTRSSGAIHLGLPASSNAEDIGRYDNSSTINESPKSARRGSPASDMRTLTFRGISDHMISTRGGSHRFDVPMYNRTVTIVKVD